MKFIDASGWVVLSEIEQRIKEKVEAVGVPLKDWNIRINYGIKTGFNEAFIIDGKKRGQLIAEDPKSAEIIRPILRGRDIKKCSYEFADLYVILAHFGSHKIIPTQYPAIHKHLVKYELQLKARGQCRYTSSGKANSNKDALYHGQHHWLELDNNPTLEKLDDFNRQKIMYSEIVREPQFYLDKEGAFFAEATSFILTGEHLEYLYHLLHSKAPTYFFRTFYAGGGLGETGYRYKKAFLENLPVPKPNTKIDFNEKNLDEEVYKLYELTKEEIAFIDSQ
jgi:hypothetical protein